MGIYVMVQLGRESGLRPTEQFYKPVIYANAVENRADTERDFGAGCIAMSVQQLPDGLGAKNYFFNRGLVWNDGNPVRTT